jgi:hypothetical protein
LASGFAAATALEMTRAPARSRWAGPRAGLFKPLRCLLARRKTLTLQWIIRRIAPAFPERRRQFIPFCKQITPRRYGIADIQGSVVIGVGGVETGWSSAFMGVSFLSLSASRVHPLQNRMREEVTPILKETEILLPTTPGRPDSGLPPVPINADFVSPYARLCTRGVGRRRGRRAPVGP